MMSPGTSLISYKSKITHQQREVLLTAPYFSNKDHITNLSEYTNLFFWTDPSNTIERTIIEILDQHGIDYSNRYIEYWFQHQVEQQYLDPHCDFNYVYRDKVQSNTDKTIEMGQYISPITVACYLFCDNLVGGDLCISHYSWDSEVDFNGIECRTNIANKIASNEVERYTPKQDDIITFEGSKYYHWIDKVLQGERKSMLINFWNRPFEG